MSKNVVTLKSGSKVTQGESRGRPKMHFSFSAVNENADENEIPFSAEKRKRKSPVPIPQNLVMVKLRT